MVSIFVSSVQTELADERRAVKAFVEGDALLRRFFRVFLFEDLPATDRRVDEVYLAEVDHCEVCVGLFGNDYGFEDAAAVSPTEHEFDRATTRGKVRLVPGVVKGADDRARHAKMATLMRKAGDQLIRRRFGSAQELMAALYASLVDHLERTDRLRVKPFDAAACAEAVQDDLSPDKLDLFLARAQTQRGYIHGPGTPIATALAHLNLLDRSAPTHAAVLLFGLRPQRFIPTSEVKCMHFHGTPVRKPIDSYQIFKGSVFELVDDAVDFVMSKIARRVGTRAETTQVPVNYELPREAVVEAIVNAVAHRDYASNASVQVMQRPLPATPEVTPEVEPQLRVLQVLIGEMTRQQLQTALGLKDDKHFRSAYLQPALDSGLIEMTAPDKPRSSRQKYRRVKRDKNETNGT